MARPNQQQRSDPRLKKCDYCEKNTLYIDYKDYGVVKPFIDYFGNIRKRYYTGVCLKHQKMLKTAIERARYRYRGTNVDSEPEASRASGRP